MRISRASGFERMGMQPSLWKVWNDSFSKLSNMFRSYLKLTFWILAFGAGRSFSFQWTRLRFASMATAADKTKRISNTQSLSRDNRMNTPFGLFEFVKFINNVKRLGRCLKFIILFYCIFLRWVDSAHLFMLNMKRKAHLAAPFNAYWLVPKTQLFNLYISHYLLFCFLFCWNS